MSEPKKVEAIDMITVRLPDALARRVEQVVANSFSTKSEYIRDLIRRDIANRSVHGMEQAATDCGQ